MRTRQRSALLLLCWGVLLGVSLSCNASPATPAGCPDGQLPAPQELESPSLDQDPQASWAYFRWNFPADCAPASFEIQVARDPSFTQVEAESGFEAVGHEGDQYSLRFVDTGFQLDPGRYYWRTAAASSEGQGPFSARQLLLVGPACIQGGYGEFVAPWPQAPVAIWPPDGGGLYSNLTSDRYLTWDYAQCTISEEIHHRTSEVQLADNPRLDGAIGESDLSVNEYQIPIRLEDCLIYYWRVRFFMDMTPPVDVLPPDMGASDPGFPEGTPRPTPIVGWSDFSEVFTFRTDFAGTCGTAQEPVQEPSAAAAWKYAPITVTSGKNMNCREGPDTRFQITAIFTAGEPAALVGRLKRMEWLYLRLSNGRRCWVFAEELQIVGDVEQAPVLTPVPLPVKLPPTEGPESACRPEMEQSACEASGGQWIIKLSQAPFCQCPE